MDYGGSLQRPRECGIHQEIPGATYCPFSYTRSMPSPIDRQPSLTPFVMKVGGSSCRRWVHHQLYGPKDYQDPFHRWNIRTVLLDRLFTAHSQLKAPQIEDVLSQQSGQLLPEEQWFLEHFIDRYCEIFSTVPGLAIVHNCERATTLESRGVRLGGAVDFLLRTPDGNLQLRQLELWGRRVEADPMASWEIALAVLRLRTVRSVEGPLLISHVNLNTGEISERWIDLTSGSSSELSKIAQHFDLRGVRFSIEVPLQIRRLVRSVDSALGCRTAQSGRIFPNSLPAGRRATHLLVELFL